MGIYQSANVSGDLNASFAEEWPAVVNHTVDPVDAPVPTPGLLLAPREAETVSLLAARPWLPGRSGYGCGFVSTADAAPGGGTVTRPPLRTSSTATRAEPSEVPPLTTA